jgi:hypothetical protein
MFQKKNFLLELSLNVMRKVGRWKNSSWSKWLREVWHRRKSGALPKKTGMLVLVSFKCH